MQDAYMDLLGVYKKTDLGKQAISKRDQQTLSRHQRTLLIMVDGKNTGATILQRMTNIPDAETLFRQLVGMGFVEQLPASHQNPISAASPERAKRERKNSALPGKSAISAATVAAPPATPIALQTAQIHNLRQTALRHLTPLYGSDASGFAHDVLSATHQAELIIAIHRCYQSLRVAAGKQISQQFLEDIYHVIGLQIPEPAAKPKLLDTVGKLATQFRTRS